MKSAYILLAALFVCVAPLRTSAGTCVRTETQAPEKSPFRYDAATWDFGNVREEGGPVSHHFEFTNNGDTPIAIDRVVTSCGCTTPDYPKTPIRPGGSGRIEVIFDPKAMPGDFTKSISVVSGGGKYRDFLTITGYVIPRPRTVEEDYPHDMGGGLRVSSALLTFRQVAQGRSAMAGAGWVNTSSDAVTLSWEPVEESGLVNVIAPETLCAGCRGEITFTYDLSEKTAYGQIHDVLRPVVNGTASQKTIYTTMTGIDDFEGIDTNLAPRFFLDASFHDFGEVRQRTMPHIFRLTASNEGAEVLHVRSVSAAEGLRCTLRGGMTIAPGASLPFEVIFYSNKYSVGEVRGSIQLVVDDPMRPVREIKITATVK